GLRSDRVSRAVDDEVRDDRATSAARTAHGIAGRAGQRLEERRSDLIPRDIDAQTCHGRLSATLLALAHRVRVPDLGAERDEAARLLLADAELQQRRVQRATRLGELPRLH